MISLIDTLVFVSLLLVVGLAVWARSAARRSSMDAPEALLTAAVGQLPTRRRDWGTAMSAELTQMPDRTSRWQFALDCLRVVLFPPGRGASPVIAVAGAGVGLTVATGLLVGWDRPDLRLFAVTFVASVAVLAVLVVHRSGRLDLARSGAGLTTAALAGVAACVAVTVYASSAYSGATPVLPTPDRAATASVEDPWHATTLVFAVLLAGYLWLAVAVPGVMTPGRWGRRVGGVTALVFAGLLTFDSYGGSGFDDIGFALPATVLLFPAGAALAAILDHSVGAGVRTALWAGILGALSFVVIVTLSTVDVVRTGTDPTYLEEFARVKSADLAAFETYTVSGALGAGTVMLALLPVWALLLGLVGGAIGEAIRPSDTLAGRPVGHPAH